MSRVTQHTGSKYPIIKALMVWIPRSQTASAVCEAGVTAEYFNETFLNNGEFCGRI